MSVRRPAPQRLASRLRTFRDAAEGATTIEYTLAATMLAVTVFASMGVLTDAVKRVFAAVTTAFGQAQ